MENITHWSDFPQWSRVAVESKYGKLTDEQWDIVVSEIDNEIDNDDNGNEPLELDEQINYFVSNIKDVQAEYVLWDRLKTK